MQDLIFFRPSVRMLCALLFGVLLPVTHAGQTSAQLNVSTVPRTVSYQGYLEANGSPFDGVANFKFVISCGTTVTAWSNDGSSANGLEPATAVPVAVAQGAFSVLLGDSTLSMPLVQPEGFDGCSSVNLKIWVDTGSGFEALPAQPIVSSMFALEADVAYRGLGGFIVDDGPLLVTDDQGQQVVQIFNKSGPVFEGPSLAITNSAATKTVSISGNSGGNGSAKLQLSDSTGTEQIALDGATGEVKATSIRFADDSVQTTAATGGGGGADGDWTILGNDMYAAVPGDVGIGTISPGGHLTLSRPTQLSAHQLEFRIEGSIQSPNYDGIRFSQGPTGATTLAEMRLEYRNNGVPDLAFHLRGQYEAQPNVLFLEGSSGRVGVGTDTPGAALEVAGTETPIFLVRQELDSGADASMAIRGSRNGSTTANVASLEFRDFDSDEGPGTDFVMARIAGGMADASGQTGYLRFYTNNGTSEVEHMRISKSGDVGIGTATPGATLDVVGDLQVSGDIQLGGALNTVAQTRYLSLPTAAFVPELDTMGYRSGGLDLYGTTPGQLVRFIAPVALPHGAVIKEFLVVVDDLEAGLNDNITAYLFQRPHFGGSGTIVSHKFTSGAPGSYFQMVEAENQLVDNENNTYYVSVEWNTPSSGNVYDLRVRSVRITYEITQLAP